jgi:hypothetical protein
MVECKKSSRHEQSALEIEFEESRSFLEGELERVMDQSREIEVGAGVLLPRFVVSCLIFMPHVLMSYRSSASSWNCGTCIWRAWQRSGRRS